MSLLLLLVVVIYFGAQQFAADSRPASDIIPGEGKPWKLEVVNLAGDDGLAGRMTRYLRRQGYDVVDFHSRQMAGHEKTVLIDRTGDPSAARDLAERLGIGEDRVVTEIDRTLFVDVTVVLGFDYRTIPSLKHLQTKDMP